MKKLLQILLVSIIAMGCEEDNVLNEELEHKQLELTRTTKQQNRQQFYLDLAYHHAPIHYQDVDKTGSHGLSGKADYITRYDFDGDLNATNNWDNIKTKAAEAVSYYSVVETTTHYFIIYAFFHPRDWTDIFFLYRLDEHENDLEGVLTIVKKDNSAYGEVLGIVTVFHSDFFSFKAPNSGLRDGNEDIDGTLSLKQYDGVQRFETAAEAKGHGIKAYSKLKPGGSDYVIYYPSKTISEVPNDVYDRFVQYQLVDIYKSEGMWEERCNGSLFNNCNSFRKSYGSGTANAPWNWDDKNDGGGTGLLAGGLAKYPAHLVDVYFNGMGNFSKTYTYNPYLGIE